MKPSKEAEGFIEDVFSRVGASTKAVLARSAITLAIAEPIPPSYHLSAADGKDIGDDALVGEIEPLIRAALNFRAGKTLDDTEYKKEFRRHFEWGCKTLKEIWEEEAQRDPTHFVSLLLQRTKTPPTESENNNGESITQSGTVEIVSNEIKLKILAESDAWSLNGKDTSNGLLIISGEPGSGKTQLVLDLLAQLAAQGARFIFFDLKGELEADPTDQRQSETRNQFLTQTGASYVRLVKEPLPINPLWREKGINDAPITYAISELFRAFVPALGAVQIGQLEDAYNNLEKPDFASWLSEIEQNEIKGVPRETLKKICAYNLFATANKAIPLKKWIAKSLVIDFKEIGNDESTKSLTVALLLNFFMKRLNQQLAPQDGIQPIKMVLFVDEAHLLLPKEGKVGLLGSLARQGRSWGFPVWLASQDTDAFVVKGGHAVDFAELANCGIHFTLPNLSPAEKKRLLGGNPPALEKGEAAVKVNGKLQTGAVRQYWRDKGGVK